MTFQIIRLHHLKLLLIFLLWLALPASLQAREQILHFDSDIRVFSDASMEVTETIRVKAEGQKIKRGIYRDFPTHYRDRYGSRVRVDFEILEILKDGKPEPYHQKSVGGSQRVYLGESDVYLKPGVYTYTIKYRTNRQLGFFENHDELYWNVTGNQWEFTIAKVQATVTLPPDIPPQKITFEAYTGPSGSKGQDYRASIDSSSRVRFNTTAMLPHHHGLTIVVTWPKGFVTPPSKIQKGIFLVRDNFGLIMAILGLLAVFAYYFVVWLAVGKDPEKGTIIPRFDPPKGYSPAVLRYIHRMGFDPKAFATAVINMAVKGHLTIKKEKNTYSLIKKPEGKEPLSKEEYKIRSHLTSGMEIKQKNHRTLRAAMRALKNSLALQCEKIYFIKNTPFMVLGAILSLIFLGIAVAGQGLDSGVPAVFIVIWLSGWTFGVFSFARRTLDQWRQLIRGAGNPLVTGVSAIVSSVALLPFAIGEIAGLFFLGMTTHWAMIPLLLAFVLTNYLFYHWLKAPTHTGRKLLDEIEGFRMFLKATEKERLNFIHPPERTPELFEKYLPYALALDVEQVWAEQFTDILAAASAQGKDYSPGWYSGSFTHGHFGSMAASLGNSFSSAAAASSRAPGSSSGSSGGGSSGGGGGGGGGGGW